MCVCVSICPCVALWSLPKLSCSRGWKCCLASCGCHKLVERSTIERSLSWRGLHAGTKQAVHEASIHLGLHGHGRLLGELVLIQLAGAGAHPKPHASFHIRSIFIWNAASAAHNAPDLGLRPLPLHHFADWKQLTLPSNGGISAALDQNLRLHSIGVATWLNPLTQQSAAILTP